MVAKSFQQLKIVGEPFYQNKKQYIIVQKKDGSEKIVRWYSDKEYAKMYPNEQPIMKGWKNLKRVLGFEKGYITIFKNASYDDEWFNRSNARWHERWGWYIISTEEVPANCPTEQAKLYWKDVSIDDENLKSKDEIEQIIYQLLYDDSPSDYIGNIGDRLELNVNIFSIQTVDTSYGKKAIYLMEDEQGNVFKWFTSIRKDWFLNSIKTIRGTVKELKKENGIKITVLTRCIERK